MSDLKDKHHRAIDELHPIKSVSGRVLFNNRALMALLRELNITLWSLDMRQHFHTRPLIEDLYAMAMHLNWSFAMKRSNQSPKALYMALVRDSHPTFQTFCRWLHGMGLRFRVEPDPRLDMVFSDRDTQFLRTGDSERVMYKEKWGLEQIKAYKRRENQRRIALGEYKHVNNLPQTRKG